MGKSLMIFVAASCALSAAARAQDASPLPMLALNPQATTPSKTPWSGLYIGTEIFAVSGRGKGGGIGGGGHIGYNKELANNIVIGIQANAGYSPSLFRTALSPRSVTGYDYASTNIKVGYDMGRIMPYVTAGVGLAKPNIFGSGFTNTGNSLENILNPQGTKGVGGTKTFTSVGAGFDYAVTDKLTVGIAVSAGTGRAFIAP